MYILTQIQYSTTTNVNYDTMNHNRLFTYKCIKGTVPKTAFITLTMGHRMENSYGNSHNDFDETNLDITSEHLGVNSQKIIYGKNRRCFVMCIIYKSRIHIQVSSRLNLLWSVFKSASERWFKLL